MVDDTNAQAPSTELWVERTGVRRYTGRSSRGAEVLVIVTLTGSVVGVAGTAAVAATIAALGTWAVER